MTEIVAIVNTMNAGNSFQQEEMERLFEVGDRINVSNIEVGGFHTRVYLENHTEPFNSVFFIFEEDGEPLDIYRDMRFMSDG